MFHILFILNKLQRLFLKIYNAQNKRMIIEEVGISGGILFFVLVVSLIYCITTRVFYRVRIHEYDDLRDFLLEADDDEVGHVHEEDEEGGILEASLDDIFPNVLSTDRDKKRVQQRRNDSSEDEKEEEQDRETPEDLERNE